jgi:hypothetical protein
MKPEQLEIAQIEGKVIKLKAERDIEIFKLAKGAALASQRLYETPDLR